MAGRNARKLATATGAIVNRSGKLKSVIPALEARFLSASSRTGSIILYNGTPAEVTASTAPEIYRLKAGTGVHVNLDLNFKKLSCAVTGTVSLNVLYE